MQRILFIFIIFVRISNETKISCKAVFVLMGADGSSYPSPPLLSLIHCICIPIFAHTSWQQLTLASDFSHNYKCRTAGTGLINNWVTFHNSQSLNNALTGRDRGCDRWNFKISCLSVSQSVSHHLHTNKTVVLIDLQLPNTEYQMFSYFANGKWANLVWSCFINSFSYVNLGQTTADLPFSILIIIIICENEINSNVEQLQTKTVNTLS